MCEWVPLLHTGVVNEYPAEFDAINFVVNNTNSLNSASIVLKTFNVSEKRNLYKQGKTSQKAHRLVYFIYLSFFIFLFFFALI